MRLHLRTTISTRKNVVKRTRFEVENCITMASWECQPNDSIQYIAKITNILLSELKYVKIISIQRKSKWKNSEAVIGRMFCEKDVVKSFAIFTGKHLCWNLF